jgi:hypothetical protein
MWSRLRQAGRMTVFARMWRYILHPTGAIVVWRRRFFSDGEHMRYQKSFQRVAQSIRLTD